MKGVPNIIGRFAPSPTGALHIGSLVTAVGSYLMAKRSGGRWRVRIDDLDTPRQMPGMVDDILRTLEQFALVPDDEISWQSRHLDAYQDVFGRLQQQGLIYPCCCSRKEIAMAASAPHGTDEGAPYPGNCRVGMRAGAAVRSWRVRTLEEEICFDDLRRGRVCQHVATQCGDFTVRRGDGVFAYQLAVVVDDWITGVNQVVRGDDLLPSTYRQIYLQRLLGLPQPAYCHLPLVTGPGGNKLSKRDHLVSHHLGNWRGREGRLLLGVLRFLGQSAPAGLTGASCSEILHWGKTNFEVERIPMAGGELTDL